MKINIYPFFWEDKYHCAIQIENLEMEEQIKILKQIDKNKDDILASVSHDLRTPINSSKFLLNECQNEKNLDIINKNINMILSNLDLLLNLIQDILDYRQIKENKINLNPNDFSLTETINEIGNIVKYQIEMKNLKLIVKNTIPKIYDIIYSDQKRLKQILINLLTNAIKFTKNGAIEILANKLEKFDILKITISDTGCGIPKNILPNLCEQFKTYNTNSLNNDGIGIKFFKSLGLGLNISKKYVALLGPKPNFEIESEYSKGSKFSFYIYLNVTQREKAPKILKDLKYDLTEIECTKIIKKKTIEDFKNKKNDDIIFKKKNVLNVLLVDDDTFNIVILKKLLEKAVNYIFKIEICYNGKEAVDLIKNKYFNKKGHEKCVIAGHSAHNSSNEIEKCYKSGMDFVFEKPANVEKFKDFLIKFF